MTGDDFTNFSKLVWLNSEFKIKSYGKNSFQKKNKKRKKIKSKGRPNRAQYRPAGPLYSFLFLLSSSSRVGRPSKGPQQTAPERRSIDPWKPSRKRIYSRFLNLYLFKLLYLYLESPKFESVYFSLFPTSSSTSPPTYLTINTADPGENSS